MSRHPVTPMHEADLRVHLAAQGLGDVALVPYTARTDPRAGDGSSARPTTATLYDVSSERDLPHLGRAVWSHAVESPVLAVGASSVGRGTSATSTTPGLR